MSTMLYKKGEGENQKQYCGVQCGYKIVEDDDVPAMLADGWAKHPQDLDGGVIVEESAPVTEEAIESVEQELKTELASSTEVTDNAE